MIGATQDALARLGGPRFTRRVLALAAMLVLLAAFRHLALIGVAFVIFSRALGGLGERLAPALGGQRKRGVLAVLLLLVIIVGALVFLSVRMGSDFYQRLLGGQPFTVRIADLQQDVLERLPAWLPVEGLKDKAPHLLTPAIDYVRATGRILLQLLVGLILAVVYLLDPGDMDELMQSAPEESFLGSLRRYLGFLADAIVITIQLQLLVALVNTVLTVPVLLFLRLPHIATFTAVIFLSSLVPVVGNLLSGAVLIVASYTYRGPLGVVLFVVITFVLHKIEAYYLNPRLTARHVHLPALVLICSLIAFEHVFGLVGLFLSFPALYIGIKVYQDLKIACPPPATA